MITRRSFLTGGGPPGPVRVQANSDGPAPAVWITEDRSPLRTAPERVFFEANARGFDADGSAGGPIYDDRLHDLVYLWDFGDPGARYEAPEKILDEWRDANRGFGPFVAHVYTRPGPYTVSLTVIEPASGKRARHSIEIDVKDPDRTFMRSTFTVGQGGRFPNLDAAFKSRRGRGATRLRLLRDQVHRMAATYYMRGDARDPSYHIEAAQGPGAAPVLHHSGGPNRTYAVHWVADNSALEFVLNGIRVMGDWDPVHERAASGVFDAPLFNAASVPRSTLITRCSFDGVTTPHFEASQGALRTASLTVHDTVVTNWRDIGFFAAGCGRYAFLGNRIAQNPQAAAGGPKNAPFNNHGCIRFNHPIAARIYVDGNDLYNRCGWSPFGKYRAIQPIIRWNQLQIEEGSFGYFCRNSLENGGMAPLSLNPMNQLGIGPPETHQVVPQNLVIDGNYILCAQQVSAPILLSFGGVTIRNNVMNLPNTRRLEAGPGLLAFVHFSDNYAAGGSYDSRTDPVRIYSNTCINQYSPARGGKHLPVEDAPAAFTDVRAENNLVHQPNLDPPDIDHGPIDTTPLWIPREKGYKDAEQTRYALWTDYGTSPAAAWSAVPVNEPGGRGVSDALGNALSGATAYDDLSRDQRPEPPSIGARERPE